MRRTLLLLYPVPGGQFFGPPHSFWGTNWGQKYNKNEKTNKTIEEKEKMNYPPNVLIYCDL